jgi:phosphate:Na+ symporter
LTLLLRRPLHREEFAKGMGLVQILNDLELISDIMSKNVAPLLRHKLHENISFSPTGWEDLVLMYQEVCLMMRTTHKALVKADYCLAEQAIKMLPKITQLERGLRSTHIYRLREGIKESELSSRLHLELLNAYLRISEHLRSIAFTTAGELTDARVCPPVPATAIPAEEQEDQEMETAAKADTL